ncbi:hypothetical protein CERSUDRAFT_98872 [Gelatoporia subvermispora B]|uniref:Uncharacterized protein n=1 Tax=Ceriporiopsis subvermispora (strain B) TaxID=914234 RepID=M2R1U8_CERS8|nr:hypothetical protein CERSUDRAFT_98872 [Gelatoporia subvermispora B]
MSEQPERARFALALCFKLQDTRSLSCVLRRPTSVPRRQNGSRRASLPLEPAPPQPVRDGDSGGPGKACAGLVMVRRRAAARLHQLVAAAHEYRSALNVTALEVDRRLRCPLADLASDSASCTTAVLLLLVAPSWICATSGALVISHRVRRHLVIFYRWELRLQGPPPAFILAANVGTPGRLVPSSARTGSFRAPLGALREAKEMINIVTKHSRLSILL